MKEIKINNILEDDFSVDASGPGFGSIFLLNDWYVYRKLLSRKERFTAVKSSYICSKLSREKLSVAFVKLCFRSLFVCRSCEK